MPTYPPRNNPTRKMEILDRRIHDFLKCVRNESSIEKLKNMAEKVKAAKLNLIKARLKLLEDYKEESTTKPKQELRKKLNLEKLKWDLISLEEIKIELCE